MQRAILGGAIGIGVALFALMALVVATTGWLLAAIFPEVLAVLVGGAVGFAIGQRFDRRQGPPRRFSLWLAVAVACWPVFTMAPVWARELQVRWIIARDLPAPPPGSTLVDHHITVIAFDNNPGFGYRYTCTGSTRDVLRYYHRELPKLGWEVLPVLRGPGESFRQPIHRYRKSGRTLLLMCGRGASGGQPEQIHLSYSACLANFSYRCPPLAGPEYEVVPPDEAFPDELPRGPYPPPVEGPLPTEVPPAG